MPVADVHRGRGDRCADVVGRLHGVGVEHAFRGTGLAPVGVRGGGDVGGDAVQCAAHGVGHSVAGAGPGQIEAVAHGDSGEAGDLGGCCRCGAGADEVQAEEVAVLGGDFDADDVASLGKRGGSDRDVLPILPAVVRGAQGSSDLTAVDQDAHGRIDLVGGKKRRDRIACIVGTGHVVLEPFADAGPAEVAASQVA